MHCGFKITKPKHAQEFICQSLLMKLLRTDAELSIILFSSSARSRFTATIDAHIGDVAVSSTCTLSFLPTT